MERKDNVPSVLLGAEAEGAQASRNDVIAFNRMLPVPAATAVPEVASGYRPAEPRELRRLRRVGDELAVEMVQALRQYAARGELVTTELGDLVANPAEAGRLADRIEAALASRTALASVLEYTSELLAIAKSDAVVLLDEAHDEIQHRARKQPQLLRNYDGALRVIAGRSEAISRGLARKRREQSSSVKPLRAGGAKPIKVVRAKAGRKAVRRPPAEESPSADTVM